MKFLAKTLGFTRRLFNIVVVMSVAAAILTQSTVLLTDTTESVRVFTRSNEFDYITWTLDALGVKGLQAALGVQRFLSPEQSTDIVMAYLSQVERVMYLNIELDLMYTDPAMEDPFMESQAIRDVLLNEQARLDRLTPLAESLLQDQLESILSELGFGLGGQVVPPVLYRVSELPLELIVSPRNEIRRLADISLEAGMSTDEKDSLEESIINDLNLAALVVPVGGIGAYPTMVMQSPDLVWLTEVIAHEWTHNYLTLRPLGLNYDTSSELRTINETVGSLVGKELGHALLAKYYPELVPLPSINAMQPAETLPILEESPVFDFRAEMRETRMTVDTLLERGAIEEAEQYMETRRQVFWENGYLIRKINQAYFAFYGAYNDEPGGGAAGSDPVGPAVTALREMYPTVREFLKQIAQVSSYAELLELAQEANE